MYLDDNSDAFPGVASRGAYQPMKEDWIFWNVNRSVSERDYFNNPRNSAVGPYIGNFTTNIFRCPSDTDVLKRERDFFSKPASGNPYLYSYSMLSFLENGMNKGVGSVLAPGQPPCITSRRRPRCPLRKLSWSMKTAIPPTTVLWSMTAAGSPPATDSPPVMAKTKVRS